MIVVSLFVSAFGTALDAGLLAEGLLPPGVGVGLTAWVAAAFVINLVTYAKERP